ncbi:MAG: metallopeptidase family protein [Gemmatales bacterium]|nr:metallopeptidase family protein [Gemmatales bacterium]MDW7993493.1 metallopeptidase family protein [Gemmatales bacterium]
MAKQKASMSLDEFGRIVKKVVLSLPERIRRYLDNVIVDVEEAPNEEVLRAVGLTEQEIARGETIYGLFEPMFPGAWSDALDFHTMPHRIVIYKQPLERDFPDRRQLCIEIRKTVIHELAHHFGWTDRDLESFDEHPDPFEDDWLGWGKGEKMAPSADVHAKRANTSESNGD